MLRWIDDNEFAIGNTVFHAAVVRRFESTADRFLIAKPRWMIERYLELVRELEPEHIFELGICQGGSTAFLARVAQPRKLVAIELNAERNEALDRYVEEQGLRDRVAPYYGVNQADPGRIQDILARELGGKPLDLVIDDASHLVEETRISFNTLFPHLRPGGLYVIEDWSWGLSSSWLWPDGLRPESVPLAAFVFELLLACGSTPGLIDDIGLSRGWVCLRRGDAEIDAQTFDISQCYEDRGRNLLGSAPT